MEFFTSRELTLQMGVPPPQWPISLLRELVDNALDAAERQQLPGSSPEIWVTVEPDALIVQDNGRGLPVATLEGSLDYLYRVSDKVLDVGPSRGQLGIGLKSVWAAPYVSTGEGRAEVSMNGITHHITVTLDKIAQQPKITPIFVNDGLVKIGTRMKLHWPGITSLLGVPPSSFYNASPVAPAFVKNEDFDEDPALDSANQTSAAQEFYNALTLIQQYAALNPHASFYYRAGSSEVSFPASAPGWRKWHANEPRSSHWYTVERLLGLIAGYLTEEQRGKRVFTIREFLLRFDGLTSTAKQKSVADAAGLSGASLRDLVVNGEVSEEKVRALLTAIQRESRAVKPAALGVLRELRLTNFLVDHCHVESSSIRYRKVLGVAAGVPFVLEVAFGWHTDEYWEHRGQCILGLNWSPALKVPFVELLHLLGESHVNPDDPVVVLVHLSSARLEFTDRGKTTVDLPREIQRAFQEVIPAVTKQWKTLKRQADREERVRLRDLEYLRKARKAKQLTVKDASVIAQ